MTDSLPTISDIKSITLEEFDRMSGSSAQPGTRDNMAASVSVVTGSLPTGVTPNTFITSGATYYRKALLNFLVKASNGLINVHGTKSPANSNTEIQGKPIWLPSYDGVRPSNMLSKNSTQRAKSSTNAGEQAAKRPFITSGRSVYSNGGTRGCRPVRSSPLPRDDKINTLKRKLQESQEAICNLKKLKKDSVMWSDNGEHPVDLTVTGKVNLSSSSFRPHPVGESAATSPDSHHVTDDVSRSTRDAQSQEAKNSSTQTPVVKKRRRLSEIVSSLTTKMLNHEKWL